jgi:hypothetical protein
MNRADIKDRDSKLIDWHVNKHMGARALAFHFDISEGRALGILNKHGYGSGQTPWVPKPFPDHWY